MPAFDPFGHEEHEVGNVRRCVGGQAGVIVLDIDSCHADAMGVA